MRKNMRGNLRLTLHAESSGFKSTSLPRNEYVWCSSSMSSRSTDVVRMLNLADVDSTALSEVISDYFCDRDPEEVQGNLHSLSHSLHRACRNTYHLDNCAHIHTICINIIENSFADEPTHSWEASDQSESSVAPSSNREDPHLLAPPLLLVQKSPVLLLQMNLAVHPSHLSPPHQL